MVQEFYKLSAINCALCYVLDLSCVLMPLDPLGNKGPHLSRVNTVIYNLITLCENIEKGGPRTQTLAKTITLIGISCTDIYESKNNVNFMITAQILASSLANFYRQ